MRTWQRIASPLVLLALLAPALSVLAAPPRPDGPASPLSFCSESDRFGVWDVTNGVNVYDVEELHAGWYTKWTVVPQPSHPGGMRAVQLVRVSNDGPFTGQACSKCPTWDQVAAIAQANPGSLWFIGNEPDRQDWIEADRYAQIYYDFYHFLKDEDPTSQVGIGGVVQPTPIRLQYLDRILDAYQDQYGGAMPVDVWNTHNYVLREATTGWGCGIPPETDESLAIDYEVQEHDDLDAWTWHLRLLRQWMKLRGYQDRPLVVSEFGILMPELYDFDYPRVRDFMQAAFDWMMNTTDANTGYPADDNRLVQAWAWFSLDSAVFEGYDMAIHLFDPDTDAITPLGLDFGAYTAALATPLPGTVDLQVLDISHSPTVPADGGLVNTTILARIHNAGASDAAGVVVRFQRDGAPAGETWLASVPAGGTRVASVEWTDLVSQAYTVGVEVNPDAEIVECNVFNNSLSLNLVMGDNWAHLPMILKGD
jgi:hypothetical protein